MVWVGLSWSLNVPKELFEEEDSDLTMGKKEDEDGASLEIKDFNIPAFSRSINFNLEIIEDPYSLTSWVSI